MSFSDIKGHNNITHFFKRAMALKKVPSSYIFFGPDGIGKTLMAATVAKALNCLREAADSCDNCASCVKIENKNHPDVVWLRIHDKKDAISIEQIRDLQRQINLKPYEARTKVFIIQDSHLMSEAAANCLLKTLEEPPRNSIIILITPKVEELLMTVRSRCSQIKFEPLESRLKVELTQNLGFLKDEALFLSRLGNSGISISRGIKAGALLAYKNKVLDEFNSGKNLLDENSFVFDESKNNINFIIAVLGSWFRDILLLKAGAPGSLIINSDRIGELKSLKDSFSFEGLENALRKIGDAQFYIERNVGPKLALNKLKMELVARKAEA